MISSAILLLALQTPAWAVAVAPDSAAALERAARDAERHYERMLRRHAPETTSWPSGSACDERVGRFCLRFGDPDAPRPRPLSPEPPIAQASRRSAVETLRRAFSAAPGSWRVAGSLVRFLVDDERAGEAVPAARIYAMATQDSVLGPMLLAFALHYSGEGVESEEHFRRAVDAMDPRERDRLEGVEYLLTRSERRLYRSLPDPQRTSYREDFWRAADPLYLIEGNERRREHMARWVWSRLLEDVPWVPGSHRWGDDIEELTLRYGVPVRRERIRRQTLHHVPLSQSIVERYDPDQINVTPEALRTEGLPPAVLPGDPEPMEQRRARSRHAPIETRGLVPLRHQVSRFPAGDMVAIRVVGVLPLDSAALAAEPSPGGRGAMTGLFLTDARHRIVAATESRVAAMEDSIRFGHEVVAPAGIYNYSLEIVESNTRLAGRARHPVEIRQRPEAGPFLSDIVVAEPFGEGRLPDRRDHPVLRPLPGLVLPEEATVGLYAEAHELDADDAGMSRYRVELSVHPADGESVPGRAVRWLGRRLGLTGEPTHPRISWAAETEAHRPAALAIDVDLDGLRPGTYEIRLEVSDLVNGRVAGTERVVRVVEVDGRPVSR